MFRSEITASMGCMKKKKLVTWSQDYGHTHLYSRTRGVENPLILINLVIVSESQRDLGFNVVTFLWVPGHCGISGDDSLIHMFELDCLSSINH